MAKLKANTKELIGTRVYTSATKDDVADDIKAHKHEARHCVPVMCVQVVQRNVGAWGASIPCVVVGFFEPTVRTWEVRTSLDHAWSDACTQDTEARSEEVSTDTSLHTEKEDKASGEPRNRLCVHVLSGAWDEQVNAMDALDPFKSFREHTGRGATNGDRVRFVDQSTDDVLDTLEYDEGRWYSV